MRGAHQQRRQIVILLLCSTFVVLTAQSLSACTYLYDPKEVTRTFSVEITDHRRGISDLHVQIEEAGVSGNKSKHTLISVTDDHGLAQFRDMRPGAYTISIKNVALQPEDIIVKGMPSERALRKIAILLPDDEVLAVRSVSGSIHGQMQAADPVNYEALVEFGTGVKLTLIRAVSEKIIESHAAGDSGGFTFSPLPEGLYFLHVEVSAEPTMHRRAVSEYIPIKIDPSAKAPNLDLRMSPGTCVAFAYRNGDEN